MRYFLTAVDFHFFYTHIKERNTFFAITRRTAVPGGVYAIFSLHFTQIKYTLAHYNNC